MDLALHLNPQHDVQSEDRPSYYDRNRDQVRENQRLYRESNRDKIRAIHKAYYLKNRDKITAYKRERWHQMKAMNAATKTKAVQSPSAEPMGYRCQSNESWARYGDGRACNSTAPKMQLNFLLNP